MLKQKLVCLLSVAGIISGMSAFGVSAERIPEECPGELVSYILPDFKIKDGNVTRSEFVEYLVQLRFGEKDNAISGFSDVDEYNNASGEIKLARELGIIDDAKMFYPELPITISQAKKVAVNLLGYREMAELKGGYPVGYEALASELELFESADKYISWGDFSNVIYSIIKAPLISVELNGGDSSYVIDDAATLLNTKYEIYEFSGIVTADSFTSLTESSDRCRENMVRIGNEEYIYSGENYLGYNVSGYYCEIEDEKLIITMKPFRNNELKLDSVDVLDFTSEYFTYEGESRIQSEDMYPGYSFIYNHKAYEGTDIAKLILTDDSELTFIDADRDDRYETIKMIKKDYLVVKNVNTFDMLISGSDAERGIISLGDEVKYNIKKNNKAANIHDITPGDLLCYTVSEDMLYYDITAICNEISGKVSGIDKEENIIKIGDGEYKYNSYFKRYYEQMVLNGNEATFLLDDEGKVASLISRVNAYFYGWIVKKWKDDSTERFNVKIFTESGRMENYSLSENPAFDGVKVSTDSAIDLKIDLSDDNLRFVRYFVNGNNEITKIDFSENASGLNPFVESEDAGDSLTRFYEETTATYLSSGKWFSNLCRLSDSCKIFIIPKSAEKRTDDDNYFSVSAGYFSSNSSYKINVYDIDEVNGAKAIVIFDDRTSLATEAASAVVENIEMTLNKDDQLTYMVSILRDGTFTTLEACEEISESAGKLNPGDIIRYSKSSDNKLLSFNLEYDCRNNLLLAQDSSQVKYRKGFVYSYNGGYVNILEKESLSGYTYMDMSFAYFGNIKPSHIYLTLNSDGTVKKATVRNQPDSTIKSYRSVGNECDRIITRSRFESLNSVWIYHIEY